MTAGQARRRRWMYLARQALRLRFPRPVDQVGSDGKLKMLACDDGKVFWMTKDMEGWDEPLRK